MLKQTILTREKETLKSFLNLKNVKIPDLPDYLQEKTIHYWNDMGFNIHYIPKICFNKKTKVLLWKQKPHKIFYKKINKGYINKKSLCSKGKWILIDSRDKPEKKTLWITSTQINFLKKINIDIEKYIKKRNKQYYKNDYLKNILNKKGFSSRFCLNINDINSLKPLILQILKIENHKIRLPYFIEYNYLANTFYKQWALTQTWEWLEDIFNKKQHLATGSKSVGIIGWDHKNFYSTILGFRPVIEL